MLLLIGQHGALIPAALEHLAPRIWWPFIYQYGLGLVIFLLGLWVIIRTRACVLTRAEDRLWFGVLLVGFLWYAGVHLAWYLAALYILPGPAGPLP